MANDGNALILRAGEREWRVDVDAGTAPMTATSGTCSPAHLGARWCRHDEKTELVIDGKEIESIMPQSWTMFSNTLAVASDLQKTRAWSLPDGKLAWETDKLHEEPPITSRFGGGKFGMPPPPPFGQAFARAIAHDGTLLAVEGWSGVELWDAKTFESKWHAETTAREVAFAPDDKHLAALAYQELSIFALDGKETKLSSKEPTAFAWAPASDQIAIATREAIEVRDLADKVVATHPKPAGEVGLLAWLPDGKLAALARGVVTIVGGPTIAGTTNLSIIVPKKFPAGDLACRIGDAILPYEGCR
jgi:hypothetical protein